MDKKPELIMTTLNLNQKLLMAGCLIVGYTNEKSKVITFLNHYRLSYFTNPYDKHFEDYEIRNASGKNLKVEEI